MPTDDYTLTIDDVSRRLNKSTRTIHRYKDSGRLSFVVGPTQGNPLYFSRSEVDALARELYPALVAPAGPPPVDARFWERLERLEGLLDVLERNPLLDRVVALARGMPADASNMEFEEALQQLVALEAEGRHVDRQTLGRILVRLGNALLDG